MGADVSTAKGLFDLPLEGILSHHADQQWRSRITKGVRRPLHKLREVIEKSQFQAVLGASLALGKSRRGKGQQRKYHHVTESFTSGAKVSEEKERRIHGIR